MINIGKSLEFCRMAASDKERSSYSNRDWNMACEHDSQPVFDQIIMGERHFTVTGTNLKGEKINVYVDLSIDPCAEFQYFTSESCIHDGTLLFIQDLMHKCVEKVCLLQTYYKPLGTPPNGYKVKCTVGNFILLNEYDNSGEIFRPKDKPWLMMRTTVLLPIKMEYEEMQESVSK